MTSQETTPNLTEKILRALRVDMLRVARMYQPIMSPTVITKLQEQKEARRLQQLRNARNYADNEKSDPFTFARAVTHINNGISDPDRGYEAEKIRISVHLEKGKHFSDGTDVFEGVRYNNIKRP